MNVDPTRWFRGVDDLGRYFTWAVTGDRFAAYFPDIDMEMFELSDGGRRSHGRHHHVKFWRDEFPLTELDAWKRENNIKLAVESSARPGRYFPRIQRGPEHPAPDSDARTATVRVARSLFGRLNEIFQVVEPTEQRHADVFGHELRHLLILACTEVESAWKAVLRANGYPGTRWTTRDYVHLLSAMRLDAYAVTLAAFPSYGEIWPFAGWDPANPTTSLPWYDAYNATKHDREADLKRATLGAAISALAAVHVLAVAQFGSEHVDHREFHHSDMFVMTKHCRWLEDAYIRPLATPDVPLKKMSDWADHWPREWTAEAYPFGRVATK